MGFVRAVVTSALTLGTCWAADVCLADTGGTCSWFGCHSSRGATDCKDGKCICQPGYCAYGGVCAKPGSCDTYTPGTCSLLPCKGSRGATTCVHGLCRCEEGACATDGVCYSGCPKDTGGSCKVLSCAASRKATCSWPDCVCPDGTCAWKGHCVTGAVYAAALKAAGNSSMVLSARAPVESVSDYVNYAADLLEDPLALGGAVALASCAFIGLSLLRRRVFGSNFGEPLLAPAVAGEGQSAS